VSEEQDSWTNTQLAEIDIKQNIYSERCIGNRQEHNEFHTLKQEARDRGTSSSVKQAGTGMSTGIVSSISKQQQTEKTSNSNQTNKTVAAHEPPEQKQTQNKEMPIHPYASSYSNTLTFSYPYTLIPLHPYTLTA